MAVDTWGEVNEAREIGLTRTMSVLTLGPDTEDGRVKGFYPLEDGRNRPAVKMGKELYAELGSPEEITIAIYPGDRQDLLEREDFPA